MNIFRLFKPTAEQEEVGKRFNNWYSANSDNQSQDDFYEADKPLTRVQSALEVQAACSDDFNYLSLEDSLNFGKGYPDE